MHSTARIFTRNVGLSESKVLASWAECLVSKRIWSKDVINELLQTEFRVAAILEGANTVLGFASIWAGGDPDPRGELNGHLWFDHMVKVDQKIAVSIQETLYTAQIEYVKKQDPLRRIFRAPFHPTVADFSLDRGWVQFQPPSDSAPNGILELSRARLQNGAFY